MRVFARRNLVDSAIDHAERELLLEGSWPAPASRPGRWSLDEAIDSRFASIDRLAMELAEQASGRPQANLAYLNALALRYYFVKLLRVVVFFRDVCRIEPGERLELHVAAHCDEPYADLLGQIAASRGADFDVVWHAQPAVKAPRPRPAVSWRRWAARAGRRRSASAKSALLTLFERDWVCPFLRRSTRPEDGLPRPSSEGTGRPRKAILQSDAPRVVLCGSPRILNPVCAALVARRCRVWWLCERFAFRCWWRWRGAGVEQLTCDADAAPAYCFSDAWTSNELVVDGIDLARSIEWWLGRHAAEAGRRQSLLMHRVEAHLSDIRPTALLLDEDATPLKRIAVAAARRHGARSSVVQHGAPCGPFGFAPLAADEICAWGESSRRQFEAWGIPAERIRVAGWPGVKRTLLSLEPARPAARRGIRFLLLATVPPRDERPDNVEFHLTKQNHEAMLDMVREALGRIDNAVLTVKPHPRTRDGQAFASLLNDRSLCVRTTDSRDLAALAAQSDCVLSCASTAGIEAALAGVPVVQLLPIGAGDVLPAEDWGLIGSARTAAELTALLAVALGRSWRKNPDAIRNVVAEHGRQAAARIVDGLISSALTPPQQSVA